MKEEEKKKAEASSTREADQYKIKNFFKTKTIQDENKQRANCYIKNKLTTYRTLCNIKHFMYVKINIQI